MVNKKAVLIATILIILIVGVIVGIEIKKIDSNGKYLISSEENESNVVKTNDINANIEPVSNTIDENKINDIEKNETDSTKNNNSENNSANIAQNTTTSNTTTDNTSKENDISEEAAIELVKKELGKKSADVYFYVEDEIKKGVYIISVRDNETTTEVGSYKVDTKNKTVTKN